MAKGNAVGDDITQSKLTAHTNAHNTHNTHISTQTHTHTHKHTFPHKHTHTNTHFHTAHGTHMKMGAMAPACWGSSAMAETMSASPSAVSDTRKMRNTYMKKYSAPDRRSTIK